MKIRKQFLQASALAIALASQASHAAMIISEVDAGGSSASYGADWFELTNTGNAAVDITGWKMDDNSNSFALSQALRGITSIGAGKSVIFIESNSAANDVALNASFISAWFGSNAPSGLLIGNYGASNSGVSLSTSTDAVNIFNASGSLITNVIFGASTSGYTFDNKAELTKTTISTLSIAGTNGAFTSFNGAEVGSPGAVPVPAALPLMMSALGLLGGFRKIRRG